MNTNKKDYLGYALYAFGGIGLELIIVMLEPYFIPSTLSSTMASCIHLGLTIIAWTIAYYLLQKQLPKITTTQSPTPWVQVIAVSLVIVLITSISWGGFKPLIELQTLDTIHFVFQYGYYVCEALLMYLIIAFGQVALTVYFPTCKEIPLGGIFLAITWGSVHILLKGVETGLYAMVIAILLGILYSLLKEKRSYYIFLIILLFML